MKKGFVICFLVLLVLGFSTIAQAVTLLGDGSYDFRLILKSGDVLESTDYGVTWDVSGDTWVIPGVAEGSFERHQGGVVIFVETPCNFSPCDFKTAIGIYSIFFGGWLTDGTRLIIDDAVDWGSNLQDPCLFSPKPKYCTD